MFFRLDSLKVGRSELTRYRLRPLTATRQMFSACAVKESCDAIESEPRLAYSPIPDTAFGAVSESFTILAALSEQL